MTSAPPKEQYPVGDLQVCQYPVTYVPVGGVTTLLATPICDCLGPESTVSGWRDISWARNIR